MGASGAAAVAGHDLLLYRSSADGVEIFSAVCTHEGCKVSPTEERFECPCHRSVYNLRTGEAEGGPARIALTRYTAEIADGEIRVLI